MICSFKCCKSKKIKKWRHIWLCGALGVLSNYSYLIADQLPFFFNGCRGHRLFLWFTQRWHNFLERIIRIIVGVSLFLILNNDCMIKWFYAYHVFIKLSQHFSVCRLGLNEVVFFFPILGRFRSYNVDVSEQF